MTDNVGDATVLANYKAAVTRIKAALPMTTVIAFDDPWRKRQPQQPDHGLVRIRDGRRVR